MTASRATVRAVAAAAAALALVACGSFTLLTVRVDVAALSSGSGRSSSVDVIPATEAVTRLPEADDDGYLAEVPFTGALERAALELDVALQSDPISSGATSVDLEAFVAPAAESNIYRAAYRVLAASTTLQPGEAGELKPGEVLLSADSADASFREAFATVKSGSFRAGLRVTYTAKLGSRVSYTLRTFRLSVSGYPVRALPR